MPVDGCSECNDLESLSRDLDWAVDRVEELMLVPKEEQNAATDALVRAARAVRDLQRAHDAWRSN